MVMLADFLSRLRTCIIRMESMLHSPKTYDMCARHREWEGSGFGAKADCHNLMQAKLA